MKKIIFFLLLLIPINIYATSGAISKNNIIEENGTIYGFHGKDKHCHIVEKKDDKYYAKEKVNNSFCEGIIAKSERIEITLSSCVDGDTAKFNINDQVKTVRFLAIDTEESVSKTKLNTYMGKQASKYTCKKLKNARIIEIEYDPNSDKTDKYNRDLGWIYVDNILLQNDLIKNGYAKVAYLYGDYLYTEELQENEKIAKETELGVWDNNNIIAKIYNFFQKFLKLFT